jgi:hypothetical protein
VYLNLVWRTEQNNRMAARSEQVANISQFNEQSDYVHHTRRLAAVCTQFINMSFTREAKSCMDEKWKEEHRL